MKVFVFGSNGMLGRYVSTYLRKQKFNVIDIDRNIIDAHNARDKDLIPLKADEGDVFINCIGAIPQRFGSHGNSYFISVNSVFPHQLASYCNPRGVKLIHATTDCVFSGKTGAYTENSVHDARDIYGRSKSLGEPDTATVIRTSIVGEELHNKKSLLEWVRSNKGGNINGFLNHRWNGITCLQFAKICEDIIIDGLFWNGVRHIFSEAVTKFELVSMINEIFELDINITPIISVDRETLLPEVNDKTISTMYRFLDGIPSLKEQLVELKEYSNTLFAVDN